MARRGDELGYIDRDTMKWIPVDMVTDITPRGNIIPETYREYVERRDLVDGSELRRRIEGQIAMRQYWYSSGLNFAPPIPATEIGTFRSVLRMMDELEREA